MGRKLSEKEKLLVTFFFFFFQNPLFCTNGKCCGKKKQLRVESQIAYLSHPITCVDLITSESCRIVNIFIKWSRSAVHRPNQVSKLNHWAIKTGTLS